MSEFIKMQKMMKNINLTINGPKEVVKIVKFVKPESSMELTTETPVAWSVEKNEKIKQKYCLNRVKKLESDSGLDAEREAERAQNVKLEKQRKLCKARAIARSRLSASSRKKAEAFQNVLSQYASKSFLTFLEDSMQLHAPYILDEEESGESKPVEGRHFIPKAFSAEDIDFTKDLPLNRTYLLAEEAYSFIDQYFPPKPQSCVPGSRQKDLERELRTTYRIGHLDEIKKKQFGQIYHQTRKYYMDLERFEFLERQKANNINAESRKPLVQPKVIRFRP